MSVYRTVRAPKCPVPNCPVQKCPCTKLSMYRNIRIPCKLAIVPNRVMNKFVSQLVENDRGLVKGQECYLIS